jgi:hypothetical protein
MASTVAMLVFVDDYARLEALERAAPLGAAVADEVGQKGIDC